LVIDPERQRRRARVLRPLGILVTIGGAAMLLGGIVLLVSDPLGALDVFWMPFVGGFIMFPGILMWVAGNLARASADFASSLPPTPSGYGVPAFRSCATCGNANPMTARTCQVCGADLTRSFPPPASG
jgi:hypothetical protein